MEDSFSRINDILVSVVVITYNSSSTVLETLDSIANQLYSKLELIISDDYSHDNTVTICQNWIDRNSTRFVRVKLITSEKNTGTSANLNRGIKESKGVFLKSIAGDDKLLPNCISDNIRYVTEKPETELLFSKVKYFGNLNLLDGHQTFRYHYFNLPPKKFYKRLLQGNFLPAASVFMRRELFDRIGYYDESIPLMEDWPYWMKAGYNNCVFNFMDIETIEYRVQESVSLSPASSQLYLECEKKANSQSLFYLKKISKALWIKRILILYIYKGYKYLK